MLQGCMNYTITSPPVAYKKCRVRDLTYGDAFIWKDQVYLYIPVDYVNVDTGQLNPKLEEQLDTEVDLVRCLGFERILARPQQTDEAEEEAEGDERAPVPLSGVARLAAAVKDKWTPGSRWAAMDKDGSVWLYDRKPVPNEDVGDWAPAAVGSDYRCLAGCAGVPCPDWKHAILARRMHPHKDG